MKMGFLKKLVLKIVLKTTLDKAKSLYKKGNTVEEIALKLWKNEQVAAGLNVLSVSPEDLVEMIEDKVKKIKEGEQK